jgi:hypothetical protein
VVPLFKELPCLLSVVDALSQTNLDVQPLRAMVARLSSQPSTELAGYEPGAIFFDDGPFRFDTEISNDL